MNNEFQNLPHQLLSSKTIIAHNIGSNKDRFSLADPALSIMTDFSRIKPFSITTTATIDEINDKMIACGVRLLFVVDGSEFLLGLVTYNDIVGGKPVRYLQEHGGSRNEILARDIMMPLDRLEALQYDNILNARIGDIVETMKSVGRQHILVVSNQADDTQSITGMFSSTHLEKQLGIKIELSPRANTFADIERAVAG